MWSIERMCLMCVCICVIDYVFNIKLEMFIICHCVDYMDVIKAKAIFSFRPSNFILCVDWLEYLLLLNVCSLNQTCTAQISQQRTLIQATGR